MTTIEEQRALAVSKLAELNKIKKPSYSARELHQNRAMLGRVQRQEQRRHMGQVITQKVKLQKDISDIDLYLQSVSDYDSYLASLPVQNNSLPVRGVSVFTSTVRTVPTVPTIPIAPTVLPAPSIIFGPKPVLTKTRLPRYQRRSKY